MGFFRRRTERAEPSSQAAVPPPRSPRPAEPDWRSYDGVAEAFERYHVRLTGAVARDLAAKLAPEAGSTVLDVGTGTGVAAQAVRDLLGPEASVAGVDASVEMLRVGRAAGRTVGFAAALAVDLPFRDTTFDAEIANFVVSHFTKLETGLFDMRRVLKPGGRLAVSAWGPSDDEFARTWTEVAERYVGHDILQDARQRLSPWEDRLSDPNRLRDTLYEAGFRHIDVERRTYRQTWRREDYVEGRNTFRSARYMRDMLGEESYGRFVQEVGEAFADRFAETFGDSREALIAVAVRQD